MTKSLNCFNNFFFASFCFLLGFIYTNKASSVAVSAWTLVAISCERYYAIVHPLKSRRWQTLSHAYKLIALIWCGSLLCMSPIAILSQLIPTSQGNLISVDVKNNNDILNCCRSSLPSEFFSFPFFFTRKS